MYRREDKPQPKPGLMDIAAYVPGRETAPGVAKVYKLSSNETPLGASPSAAAAIAEPAGRLEIYPDGAAHKLRDAIAKAHGLNTCLLYTPDAADEEDS